METHKKLITQCEMSFITISFYVCDNRPLEAESIKIFFRQGIILFYQWIGKWLQNIPLNVNDLVKMPEIYYGIQVYILQEHFSVVVQITIIHTAHASDKTIICKDANRFPCRIRKLFPCSVRNWQAQLERMNEQWIRNSNKWQREKIESLKRYGLFSNTQTIPLHWCCARCRYLHTYK